MSKYELMYIIDASLEEAPRKELIDRINALITNNGGELIKVDEWGKRRLAYPINYKNDGYYVLINFTAGSELPHEIERVLQISEAVLRQLIVKIEEKQSGVKPRPVVARPQFGRPATDAQPAQESAPEAEEAPAAAVSEDTPEA